MKLKSLGLYMVMVGVLFTASLAHAGQIKATHSIASATPSASGTDITLNMSISNNSAKTLTNIAIVAAREFTPTDPITGSLQITLLSPGITTTIPWSFTISSPTTPDSQGYIRLVLSAINAAGNPVIIHISSKEVTQ